jgi:hypothetical protein
MKKKHDMLLKSRIRIQIRVHRNENGPKFFPTKAKLRIIKKLKNEIQCCGSGMFIPDPDFYPSLIPDLGSRIPKQQQKRDVKKNL